MVFIVHVVYRLLIRFFFCHRLKRYPMERSHLVGGFIPLHDLPPPSLAHLSSPIDILSKMLKLGVRRCLSKAHIPCSAKFGYSSLHLADQPPYGYVAIYGFHWSSCFVLSYLFLLHSLVTCTNQCFLYFAGLAFSQLTLNSYACITTFDQLCYKMGIPSLERFFSASTILWSIVVLI